MFVDTNEITLIISVEMNGTVGTSARRSQHPGSSSGHLSIGVGVSQFGHYIRKIKILHFPALISTSAAAAL